MYFLFEKSSLGDLNISSEGICRFVKEVLEKKNLRTVSCRSFCVPDIKDKALFVLNNKDNETEKIIIELMTAIGIRINFIYASDGAPDVNFAHKVLLSMRSPWFWCSVIAILALIVFIGLQGLFWLSFWGSIGWFSSKFIMFLRISYWRSSIDKY